MIYREARGGPRAHIVQAESWGMLLGGAHWTEDAALGPRPYEIGRNEIKSLLCHTTCKHWEGDPVQKAFG